VPDALLWLPPCLLLPAGPAAAAIDNAARLLFAPNTSDVSRLMLLLAKAAACPPDAARPRRSSSSSFFHFFAASAKAAAAAHPECAASSAACQAQPACYLPLFQAQLQGHASGEEAEAAALAAPGTADAVLDFSAWQAALDAARHAVPAVSTAGPDQRSRGTPGAQRPVQQQRGRRALEPAAGDEALRAAGLGGWGDALGFGQPASSLSYSYTLRLNHSEVPPTRMRLNQVGLRRRGSGVRGQADTGSAGPHYCRGMRGAPNVSHSPHPACCLARALAV
jgi:hypothetical protein